MRRVGFPPITLSLLVWLAWSTASSAQASPDELVQFPATKVILPRAGALPGGSGRSLEQEIVLRGFAMAPTETTQESFERVMGRNPSQPLGATLPVNNVSWREAVEYCNRRSEQEGLTPCYDLDTLQCDFRKTGYRLPTEAEWLYAARSSQIALGANLGSANTKSVDALERDLRERTLKPVASFAPDARGIYDMLGNVWEWVHDYYNTETALLTGAEYPTGPRFGLERIILGGSYRSGMWGRPKTVAASDYRRGLSPERRSPYTGFRVCRSIANPNYVSLASGDIDAWLRQFDQPPAAYRDALGELSALSAGSTAEWRTQAGRFRDKWDRILGKPTGLTPHKPEARLLRNVEEDFYTGRLMELRTEPDLWEKIFVMLPKKPVREPVPVVIVPYYDVDTPAGRNLGGHAFSSSYVRHFAEQMVRRGFAAVAIRWWGEGAGEDYAENVASLYERHPNWSGLGKWVWDSQRLLDYIETIDGLDAGRIGMIGHSLGGKMTLYAAAMDERVDVAVSSEPGIGLTFSNYEDYWYLGQERIENAVEPFEQHELLALLAPRPFLLIGGDSADGDKSWHYINAAKPAYQLHGKAAQLGYYNHRQGHSPSIEAYELSLEWLERFLLAESR
jgi:formylglycine-generating enzyme required for sulfatase activity